MKKLKKERENDVGKYRKIVFIHYSQFVFITQIKIKFLNIKKEYFYLNVIYFFK